MAEYILEAAAIERRSMEIIEEEYSKRGFTPQPGTEAIIKRVIHTTADFDYLDNLVISEGAVAAAQAAFKRQTPIVTDTNMAKSGINRRALEKLDLELHCDMANPEVAAMAKAASSTRATAAQRLAAERYPGAMLVVGNAPTALIEIAKLIREGLRPSLVIAVPVGFVNVVESKAEIAEVCREYAIPYIVAHGRKGGSNVAASIVNALLYQALEQVAPETRL